MKNNLNDNGKYTIRRFKIEFKSQAKYFSNRGGQIAYETTSS